MTPVTGGPARFLFLLVAVFLAAGSAPAGRRVQLFVADGLSAVYPVEFPLALAGTDSVELDGRRLDPGEYVLDLERGLLLFAHRPPRQSVIRVSCATLPLAVPASYRRYRPVPAEPEAGPEPEPAFAPVDTAPATVGDLAIGGSKTIGVTIGGPEGSGLNQATRLAVSGTVEGVRVDAELSDQSSPIPPEGTTLEIDELDLIRIDVAAKDWRGRFGDVEFRLPTSGFGTVERRVVGGLVSGEFGPVGARLGYARPRGRFGRTVLAGMDGVQGPYQLGPGGGSAMLVPGSEAVYLDGRRLTRGWDEDYTVDYSTGELVFTGRHVITRFSRIEASYQYVLEAWERSDVIGGVSFLPGGLRVSADYYGESDDPLRSSRYELSADEREYLAGIGADTARAWLEGGTRVGAGEGDYELENGSYRYVGEGQGDYRVLFTYVGDSLGEYVFDDSIIAHRYAGAGAGDYVAAYRVELPGRSELGRVEFDYQPGQFRVGLAGIGRRSLLNLFADGGASEFGGAAAGWAGWTGERSELRYQGRAFLPGFVQPGGDSLVDIEYRWGGLEQARVWLVNELTGRQELREWLEVGADLGLLRTFDDSLLARYLGRVRAGPLAVEGGRAGNETRAAVDAMQDVGGFRPRAGWSQAWAARGGRRSWHAGLGAAPGLGLELDGGYRWVRADTTDSVGVRLVGSVGGVAEAGAVWNPGDRFRARARVAYQHRDYPASRAEDWQSWLTDAGLTATPVTGLRFQGDFARRARLVQLRDEYYRYVGPGQGGYSRDTLTGRYYPDPDGAYERTVAARGSYVPADEVVLNLSGDWSAWRPFGLTGTFSHSDVTGEAAGARLRRLRSHNLRATVRALEPVVTAWLTASGSSSEDRTLAITGRAADRRRYRAELESDRVPGTDLRLRVEHGVDDRRNAAGDADYTERLWSAVAEPVIGRWLRLELELGTEYSTIAEPILHPELGRFTLLALNAGLGRNWTFGGRWRLRVRGGVVRRTASVAELPFDVAYTRPLGWTPNAGLEASHVLSDILTLTGRYDFLNRPDRAADHRASAELRAFF